MRGPFGLWQNTNPRDGMNFKGGAASCSGCGSRDGQNVRPPGKEVSAMTGSALAPIIIPIVVVIALAAWLAMIFYADAHPGHIRHSAASGPGTTGGDERGQDIRHELAPTGAGASRRTAIPADNGASERAPSEPSRRAA
jgi:hypothetical protein